MSKISVIIPCYNAENVLDNCLESLTAQTIGIENLEIILVNDASTDGTYDRLCQWEQKYPDSIMVINCTENGRQGRARNIGLEYAGADYIGYMDIDDIAEPEMFEELYKFISRLHYGIKFMPEKDFDELLSRCDWEQKMYALCFRYL